MSVFVSLVHICNAIQGMHNIISLLIELNMLCTEVHFVGTLPCVVPVLIRNQA